MITIAKELRSQAEAFRAQAADICAKADKLDAIAASIDGGQLSAASFCGNPKAREITTAICDDLGISVSLVLSRDRHDAVVVCRDICTHALRQLLGMRQQALAMALGRPDHSVCAYSLRRVRERRQVDKHFTALLERGMNTAKTALSKLEGIAA